MKRESYISTEKILYVILIIMGIIPYSKVLPEIINPLIFIVLTILLLKIKNGSFNKKDIFIVVLLILSLISIFFSNDKVLSLMDSFYLASAFLIYLIVKNLKAKAAVKSIRYVFYGTAISALFGIIRYLTNSDERLDGLLNYANSSALIFAVAIIIYYFSLEDKFSEDFNKMRRYFSRAGLMAIITALYLTQSRGGIIVYLLAIVFGIIFLSVHKKRQIIDICICNLIGIVFSYIIFSREFIILIFVSPLVILPIFIDLKDKIINKTHFYSLLGFTLVSVIFFILKIFNRLSNLSINSGALQERLVFYGDAIRIIRYNLFGIGAGSYVSKQYIYQSANYGVKYVHNGFLQMTVDFGILFFIIFILFIILSMVNMYKNNRLKSVEFLIVVMIMVHSIVDFSMSFVYVNIILFLCIGILNNYELNNIEPSENKKIVYIGNSIKGFSIFISIILSIFLPGQIIYNVAVNYGNSGDDFTAYRILSSYKLDKLRTARYYEKLSIWQYNLYSSNGDNKYLDKILEDINTCLKINPEDARIYEIKGEFYYSFGNYKSAEKNFNISKEKRKFYLPIYDEINQCYDSVYSSGEISKADYDEKLKTLNLERDSLIKSMNPRAIYMKNQNNSND